MHACLNIAYFELIYDDDSGGQREFFFGGEWQPIVKYYKKQKLASVSLYCKSRRSKTANIKILSANSTHRS